MKLLVIGFGHAGQAYLKACLSMPKFKHITVVDIDPAVKARVDRGVRFSSEVPKDQFDLAIIATPPASHLKVLRVVHERAARILLEKPFALIQSELNAIFSLAEQGKIFFSIHSTYGEEIELGLAALRNIEQNSLIQVSQIFTDPYWPDGPKNLGGPFWDSIYNALAILNNLFPDVKITKITHKVNRLDYFYLRCAGTYGGGSLEYELVVDWRPKMNLKVTEVSTSERRRGILLNHSQQCVSSLSGLDFQYKRFMKPRLASHYQSAVSHCLGSETTEGSFFVAKEISKIVMQIADHSSI